MIKTSVMKELKRAFLNILVSDFIYLLYLVIGNYMFIVNYKHFRLVCKICLKVNTNKDTRTK